MWSYGPQNAPSGNRQHQIEKNRCRFCSLLKYVMDLSQGIWEKQSRKLPEGRAQPHSSSRASPGLHVQYFPSFPRYWQVTPFQINCWKWQKTFFLTSTLRYVQADSCWLLCSAFLTLLFNMLLLTPPCKQNASPGFQVAHWPKQHPLLHYSLGFTRWLHLLVCRCGYWWQSLMLS